ncbi:MAG: hypothetical protein HY369_03950 [Candidatus Aenigmarchaeota archaeon]|nr:hypothetical protein [Candidatus Aenigmarchaeota archaeon]
MRETQSQGQERSARTRKRLKTAGWVIVVVVVLAAAAFGVSSYTGYMTQQPGQYDAFAQCLTDQGMVEYGAYWCPNCARQKLDFGNSFRLVNYVECAAGDPEGKAQPALCDEKGITGYPTWITKDGQRLVGRQSLESLAAASGCPL